MIGKKKRMNRLFNRQSGKIILIPMDHGFTLGPVKGLDHMDTTIKTLVQNGVDSLLMHKGMIAQHYQLMDDKNLGLIMHLSGSTSIGRDPLHKVATGCIDDALRMGCDAVSVHINIGSDMESDMIRDVSSISSECYRYGMPLMVMAYARGSKINNEYEPKLVKHAARVGVELGADLIKVNYTGDMESFSEVVKSCPVPVVIAGGEKVTNDTLLIQMVCEAIQSGAKGISIGRNIFQHDRVESLLNAISSVVHQNDSLENVLEKYQVSSGSMSMAAGQ